MSSENNLLEEGGQDAAIHRPAEVAIDLTRCNLSRAELIEGLAQDAWARLETGDVWGAVTASVLAIAIAEYDEGGDE